jgi:N-acyl-D-aspartate/D-glutamate deacylase
MSGIVIKGGTVVDGTGAPGFRADVAIDRGRISRIAPDLDGDLELDASDHVVAPGFIDIHTHYDAQVFWDPPLTPSCFHGVTTVVAGNCGFTIAPIRPEHPDLIARTLQRVEDMDVNALRVGVPWTFESFPEYLSAVQANGLGLNFSVYVGHSALRLYVMGDDAYERAATPDEVATMQSVLRAGMATGATGFATSYSPTHNGADGKPVPSRQAERSELEALLATLAGTGKGVAQFTAGEDLMFDDIYDLQRRIGGRFTYAAVLAWPNGSHLRVLEVNREARERGAEVWPQVSPTPLRFSMLMTAPFILNANPVFGELVALEPAARAAAFSDAEWRRQALAFWDTSGMKPRWETFEVQESELHPELVGRRLSDVASETGRTAFDVLLDAAALEPTIRIACTIANDDEDEVAKILKDEYCTLGVSDAGAHVGQICDAPQATQYLGHWIRDRGLLPLEEAVHRLTMRQAEILGFSDRGRLVPGAAADVVVFDPASISTGPVRRVRDFPADSERLTADAPTGMRHVLVNGVPIRIDGVQDLAVRPGQLVSPSN